MLMSLPAVALTALLAPQESPFSWEKLPPSEVLPLCGELLALDSPCKFELEMLLVSLSAGSVSDREAGEEVAEAYETILRVSAAGDAWVAEANRVGLLEAIESVRRMAMGSAAAEHRTAASPGLESVLLKIYHLVHTERLDRMSPGPVGDRAQEHGWSYLRTTTLLVDCDYVNRAILVQDRNEGRLAFYTPRSLYFPLLAHPPHPERWAQDYEWARAAADEPSPIGLCGAHLYRHRSTSDGYGHSVILMDPATRLPLAAGYVHEATGRAIRMSIFIHDLARDGQTFRLRRSFKVDCRRENKVRLRMEGVSSLKYKLEEDDLRIEIPPGMRVFDHRGGGRDDLGTHPEAWPREIRDVLRVEEAGGCSSDRGD